MAMAHADWTITEAGFGFDMGAEKFFDIKCVSGGLDTAAVVLVATIRALKRHGGIPKDRLEISDPAAVQRGLGNLQKHIENIQTFTEIPVVALNRFHSDTDEEIEIVRRFCADQEVPFAESNHFAAGGEGALELADTVLEHAERHTNPFRPLYGWSEPIKTKMEKIAKLMYGAATVNYTKRADRQIRLFERLGYAELPLCVAKTPTSLTDDPTRAGRPQDFEITVRDLIAAVGAGYVVPLLGDIMRMPGLPKVPRANTMDVRDGEVVIIDAE